MAIYGADSTEGLLRTSSPGATDTVSPGLLRFRVAMNEASAKTANSEDEAAGVHRLRDIVVEEVSLVDRAANQRRFLVVKRSAEMADESNASAEAKPEARGTVEKAKKKPAGVPDEMVDEEKAKKPVDDEETDPTDAEKARGAARFGATAER